MSYKSFFIADTHFGHKNIITFTDNEGKRTRPFDTIEDHDNHIIENWNKVVRPCDRVYMMGDVVMNRKNLPILNKLNGKKVLIKGNHDIFKLKDYIPYFYDIRAYKIMPKYGIIFSHIPLHDNQLQGRWKINFHGHMHQNKIDDPRYVNLCCENIDYIPIELNDLLDKYNLI